MPIYEFYCKDCHTIYSFLSRKVNINKIPVCPGCKKDGILTRKVSPFSIGLKREEGSQEEDFDLPVNEGAMEYALGKLAGEAENIDENDPKAAANLMRKFADMTGLKYSKKMEEAIDMIESSNDPDSAEEKVSELMDGEENPFVIPGKKGIFERLKQPERDDRLYEM